MGAGSLLTGLAIYKPTQAHWLTTLLGGYEMARWEHFWLALGFCGFFAVHITQVVLAGWNNFRSMVSGLEVKSVEEPSLEAEKKELGMNDPETEKTDDKPRSRRAIAGCDGQRRRGVGRRRGVASEIAIGAGGTAAEQEAADAAILREESQAHPTQFCRRRSGSGSGLWGL